MYVRVTSCTGAGSVSGQLQLRSEIASPQFCITRTVSLSATVVRPDLNSTFVDEVFPALLYRQPSAGEKLFYESFLGGANATSTVQRRAEAVLEMMGYNASITVNPLRYDAEYGRGPAIAFAPFARLGRTPTTAAVIDFVNAINADTSALGGFPVGVYSGINGSPWGATTGMAEGMRQFFATNVPSVLGLDNNSFLLWLGDFGATPVMLCSAGPATSSATIPATWRPLRMQPWRRVPPRFTWDAIFRCD